MPRAAGPVRRSGRRRVILSIVFTLLITAALLVAAEGTLRLLWHPRDTISHFRGRDVFVLDLLWIPDPFTSTELGRRLAQRPFVDHTWFTKEKPPDTLRIICMGGSVTQGFGHEPEFAYPHQLERILNERYRLPMKVQVLNAGNLGGNAYSSVFYFEHLCRPYHPDIVTLQHVVNDASPSPQIGLFMTDKQYVETHRFIERRPLLRRARALLRGLRLYRAMQRGILAASHRISMPDGKSVRPGSIFPARNPPDVYEESLRRYFALADEDGFEVVMVYEGSVFSDYVKKGGDPETNPYWAVMAELARERGATFIQPDRVFGNGKDARGPYFFDGVHMTKEGLRLFAERMAEDLIETGVIDRAIRRKQAAQGITESVNDAKIP